MAETLNELGGYIQEKLGSAVSAATLAYGELTIHANAGDIVRVLGFLRDDADCGFICFTDICGADYPEREKRFDVVYHLLAPYKNRRIRVKIETDDATPVPTAIPVFPAANWFERETFDLYGVMFADHPDLRRILTDYGFSGGINGAFPITRRAAFLAEAAYHTAHFKDRANFVTVTAGLRLSF